MTDLTGVNVVSCCCHGNGQVVKRSALLTFIVVLLCIAGCSLHVLFVPLPLHWTSYIIISIIRLQMKTTITSFKCSGTSFNKGNHLPVWKPVMSWNVQMNIFRHFSDSIHSRVTFFFTRCIVLNLKSNSYI